MWNHNKDILCSNLAANLPSGSTNQWRSLHWKSWDSRYIKPADCMVPVQPPRLQDSSQSTSPRNRGGAGPWLPPRRSICQGWSPEEHRVCRCCWIFGCRWSDRNPKHLLDHVWSCILHWRRAINCPKSNLDWKEEGAWPVANCRWLGQVHWRILLWWDFWCHLGIFPSLCHKPSLLC